MCLNLKISYLQNLDDWLLFKTQSPWQHQPTAQHSSHWPEWDSAPVPMCFPMPRADTYPISPILYRLFWAVLGTQTCQLASGIHSPHPYPDQSKVTPQTAPVGSQAVWMSAWLGPWRVSGRDQKARRVCCWIIYFTAPSFRGHEVLTATLHLRPQLLPITLRYPRF